MRLTKRQQRLLQIIYDHRASPLYHLIYKEVGMELPRLLATEKDFLTNAGLMTTSDVVLHQKQSPLRMQELRYDLTDNGRMELATAKAKPSRRSLLEVLLGTWFKFNEARA